MDNEFSALARLTVYPELGQVFAALRGGYVDAAAGMEGALKQYLDDYPGEYRLLNMSFRSQAQGVAFRKNGDTALADITADGTTAAIISAHGLNVEKNVYGGTTNADSRSAE